MDVNTGVIYLVYSFIAWIAVIFIIITIRIIMFTRNTRVYNLKQECHAQFNTIQECIMQMRHEIRDVEKRLRVEIKHELQRNNNKEHEEAKLQVK